MRQWLPADSARVRIIVIVHFSQPCSVAFCDPRDFHACNEGTGGGDVVLLVLMMVSKVLAVTLVRILVAGLTSHVGGFMTLVCLSVFKLAVIVRANIWQVSCDFESDWCKWTNVGDVEWRRHVGRTSGPYANMLSFVS